LLAKARSDADVTARGNELDQLGSHVDTIFRTARGMVAQLKDSRALAQVGQDFRVFDSLVDYREHYRDQQQWEEIEDLGDKRRFFATAAVPLQKINPRSFKKDPVPLPASPDANALRSGEGATVSPRIKPISAAASRASKQLADSLGHDSERASRLTMDGWLSADLARRVEDHRPSTRGPIWLDIRGYNETADRFHEKLRELSHGPAPPRNRERKTIAILRSMFAVSGRLNRARFWSAFIFVNVFTIGSFLLVSLITKIPNMPKQRSEVSIGLAAIVLCATYAWILCAITTKRLH